MDAYKQVEQTCVSLNELKQLENAINERLCRFGSGVLAPVTDGLESSQLSARQRLTLQYDLLKLTTRYRSISSCPRPDGLDNLEKPTLASLDAVLAEITDLTGNTLRASRNVYERHSRAKGLARFRCEFTDDVNVDQLFTEEEHYGEFFDLHGLHQMFINIRERESSYNSFVQNLPDITPLLNDPDAQYDSNLKLLLYLRTYLLSFSQKSHPLCAPLSDSQEYQALSGNDDDDVKKTGGEFYCSICKKQFTSEGIYKHHFDGRKHLKAAREASSETPADGIPLVISQVNYLLGILSKTAQNTADNGIRRQAMSEAEKLSDSQNSRRILSLEDEQETENDDEGEDNDAMEDNINETKGLLGPDGVPIPRWLYNLHGYSEEFNCEICANQLYMGRKLFQRHFHEPRHINGLLALGISTNMDAYIGLAALGDVQKLRDEMSHANKPHADPNLEPEMEDSRGNVMTEKIYNDLKKQGLA